MKVMPSDTYPKFRAAAVQAASVFMDRDATIEKVEDIVKKLAARNVDLIVFPESFVPGFPVWNILYAPIDQHAFYRQLFDNAVSIPGPHFEKLAQIARTYNVFLSIGVTEKGHISMGAMWNTNLLFDRSGKLLNRHRKLVPTWAEKLTWANGDASGLNVSDTEIGKIGALICGENTNPLSRFALLGQGEQVHISTYTPCFPFQRPEEGAEYNLTNAIKLRAAAHSFEGKVFNIVSSGILDEDAIEKLSLGDTKIESVIRNAPKPASLIVGPTGELIGEPVVGMEGVVEAEIDLSQSIILKQVHDVVGYYNRFDIYQLKVNKRPHNPLIIEEVDASDDSVMKFGNVKETESQE